MGKRRRKNPVDSWSMSDKDYTFLLKVVENFHFTKEYIKDREYDIIHATPVHDDNGGGRSNTIHKPTEQIVSTMEQDVLLQTLKKEIRAIEQCLKELDEEKLRFVEYVFWGRNRDNLQKILKEFSIAPITYNRWKKNFLMRVGLLTGYYRPFINNLPGDNKKRP